MNQLRHFLEDCYRNNSAGIAIQSGTENLSYLELNQRRQALEGLIGAVALEARSPIGLLLPKSPNAIAAILACLKLDLPYVPIDFDAPFSRSKYIFEDASCNFLITTKERAAEIYQLLTINKEPLEHPDLDFAIVDLRLQSRPRAENRIGPDVCYILYTSGSTGKPKGVLITATNAICFVEWAGAHFNIDATLTLASIAPFHFDLSIFDLFVSLKAGATIALFTAKEVKNPLLLAHYLAEWKVNVIYATPSLLQLLLRYGKLDRYGFSVLRQVLFAGEVFPVSALRLLSLQWPQVSFYNLYGPTETNVVTYFSVPRPILEQRGYPYPIGQLCPYAKAQLRTGDQTYPLEVNMEGELLIAGDSVAAGYLGLPELEGKRFLQLDGAIWYATGDLVRVDKNRDIVYVGRIDRMVKRRGYRIEMAEIENCMSNYEGVTAFGAVPVEQDGQLKIIGCYESNFAIPELDLKQYFVDYLPLYMQPDRFLHLKEIPLTSSQKVDFQALKNIAIKHV